MSEEISPRRKTLYHLIELSMDSNQESIYAECDMNESFADSYYPSFWKGTPGTYTLASLSLGVMLLERMLFLLVAYKAAKYIYVYIIVIALFAIIYYALLLKIRDKKHNESVLPQFEMRIRPKINLCMTTIIAMFEYTSVLMLFMGASKVGALQCCVLIQATIPITMLFSACSTTYRPYKIHAWSAFTIFIGIILNFLAFVVDKSREDSDVLGATFMIIAALLGGIGTSMKEHLIQNQPINTIHFTYKLWVAQLIIAIIALPFTISIVVGNCLKFIFRCKPMQLYISDYCGSILSLESIAYFVQIATIILLAIGRFYTYLDIQSLSSYFKHLSQEQEIYHIIYFQQHTQFLPKRNLRIIYIMAIPITFAGFEFATFIDNNIINSFSIPSIIGSLICLGGLISYNIFEEKPMEVAQEINS